MDRTRMAPLRQFLTQAETLGLKLPKGVLQARAVNDKVSAGVAAIPAHNLTGVAVAVADALSRDSDPLTDPAVAKAIALSVITGTGVFIHIEAASLARLADSCDQAQDEIVAELRKPFDQAAAALVLAHERIGDLDLTDDTQLILAKGGDIAKIWATAVEANKLIDQIILAWFSLSQIIRTEQADRRWINLRLVNTDAETFDRLNWGRVAISAWDAVRAGVELSLPTLSEYTERRAVLTEQRAEIAAVASRAPKRPSYLTH